MSELNVVSEGQGTAGLRTGRTWQTIVDSLVKSGEIFLREYEEVTEVEIQPGYGIQVKIEMVQSL